MNSVIDTSAFIARSTRSTSTSGSQGASIEDILKRGFWSNKSSWQRFYNKYIVKEEKISQEIVFKSAWDL